MYISLHVNNRSSCHIVVKLEFSQKILEKYSNIKIHENASSGSRVFPCWRMNVRTDGQTLRPVIVAFRNFMNAPKNGANRPNRVLVSTIWGSHSFLLDVCPETLSRWVKWLQRKASRSLILSSVEHENECSYKSTPLWEFKAFTSPILARERGVSKI